ncbi:Putative F0F1 ATP synthase subunit delta [Candidatus Phycorickettsia trachydisci]|uniref:ATP synthase subunit delta n=1 Tax=Candidatus Phycorickettsia trachydisci TaxID=2115978 RepID=A0A2P1P756_9RICK|nr:ATP synthase F1 subunit delta [Candidatus Phycorickettsia trachydisci]AVP87104.1 Putative F0F1 ATP synthase subunit delta [Candidatus Phycorickettsia trachydisci]
MFFAPKLVVNYAIALFKVAGSNPEISDQLKTLNELVSKLHENYNERLFIYDDSCKAILDNVKKQKFDPIIVNLVTKLLDKRRLDILPKLILYFEELRRHSLGIEIAQVHSARKLSDKETKDISLYLDKRFDKKFEIEQVIDSALVGGVKIIFDSFLLDNSVEGKLRKTKDYILNAV